RAPRGPSRVGGDRFRVRRPHVALPRPRRHGDREQKAPRDGGTRCALVGHDGVGRDRTLGRGAMFLQLHVPGPALDGARTLRSMEPTVRPTVRLSEAPRPSLASTARRFVHELCNSLLTDPDASSRVALATHELIENLSKYSCGGPTTLDVELTEHDGRDYV